MIVRSRVDSVDTNSFWPLEEKREPLKKSEAIIGPIVAVLLARSDARRTLCACCTRYAILSFRNTLLQ
ncbi:hypothetical protein PUN28_015713 [Cardiocondyla obscurior]|uniref:Uncharacterized protein n=1 Tax=Cardiocondyla obscurior TaxID=286306 RepID=A0AAW2EZD4_9HYME